jgi:hypothetical protein
MIRSIAAFSELPALFEFQLVLDSQYTEWRESILLSGVGCHPSVFNSLKINVPRVSNVRPVPGN